MTTTKQGAAPVAASEAPIRNNMHANTSTLSPRLHRLACALLRRPHSSRELIDVIPTNNPPVYVAQLRRECGLTVGCKTVRYFTVDGSPSWYGLYHLTQSDKEKLQGRVSQ
jgi:hypothetical protein